MMEIRGWVEPGSELFYMSQVATTKRLFELIVRKITEEFGQEMRGITKKWIEEQLHAHEFGDVVARVGKFYLSVTVDEIAFTRDNKYALVSTNLMFSLHGGGANFEKVMGILAEKIGLEKSAGTQTGVNIKIILTGGEIPYEVPNPYYYGNGHKCYDIKTKGNPSIISMK